MKVDDRILAFYTKAAHRAQRLTGRTCYWFAQQCAVIVAIRLAGSRWIEEVVTAPLWMDALAAAGFLLMAGAAAAADRAFTRDPSVLPALAGQTFKRSARILRVSVLVLSIFSIPVSLLHLADAPVIGAIRFVSTLALCSHYYLIAVVPMPPAAKRDRVRGTLIPHLQGAKS